MIFKLMNTVALSVGMNSTAKTLVALQPFGAEELVRVRCSTDGSNIYTEWKGSVYAFVPEEKPQKLFDILGMNVARCLKNQQGTWFITSRELTFYLDPLTGKVLNRWHNPWTQEVVPVVHVANKLVQNTLSEEFPTAIAGSNVTFVLDVPLTYPNVLASDPKFQDYSPSALYQAGEFFKLTAPVQEVINSKAKTVKNVFIDWNRVGPWLPWMKMKGKPGHLVYSATCKKLLHFEKLSPLLQKEINSRLPLYREAPRCLLAAKNETSWTYFRKHFQEYLKGERFPLPAPVIDESCQEQCCNY